jgi:hypothetical protein
MAQPQTRIAGIKISDDSDQSKSTAADEWKNIQDIAVLQFHGKPPDVQYVHSVLEDHKMGLEPMVVVDLFAAFRRAAQNIEEVGQAGPGFEL